MADYLVWISLFALLGLFGVIQQLKADLERRVSRLEQKIDKVMEHLGIAQADPVPPEVAGLIQAGRKIEAIKVYRRATGAGLKEAKEAVERIESKQ
jgi:ferritin-like metal-binding protein YciE